MKKIMLVDDVEISNFIMKKIIANAMPNNQVFDFTRPEEAIKKLPDIAPDVLFLDLNMPVIDGWQFLDIMQERGYTNQVFILTSSTSDIDRQKSLDYKNVAGFLVKPLSPGAVSGLLNS